MVIKIKKQQPSQADDIDLDDDGDIESNLVRVALEELRTSGKRGRTLAKALKKLKTGKLKAREVQIGIVASILKLDSREQKRILLGFWAEHANLGSTYPVM